MAVVIQYLDWLHNRFGTVERCGEPVLIGQSRDCDIRIKGKVVSRRHARIYREATRDWIEDLGSEAGTWINGVRVNHPSALSHRDQIRCGDLELEYFEN